MKIFFLIGFILGVFAIIGQGCGSSAPTAIDSSLYNSDGTTTSANGGRTSGIPGSNGGSTSSLQLSAVQGNWATACLIVNDSTGSYHQKQIVSIGAGNTNSDGTSSATIQIAVISSSNDVNCQSGSQMVSSGSIALNPQGYSTGMAAANLQLNNASSGVAQNFYDLLSFDGVSNIYFGLRNSPQTSAQSQSQRPTQINSQVPFTRTN